MRERLPTIATTFGAVISLVAALSMRDHVRLVDIIALFFGGVGTGAGVVGLVVARRFGRGAKDARSAAGAHPEPR